MPYFGMLNHVALVRTDVLEEHIATIILVLIRTTRGNIQEDGILQSHLRDNLKSYIALTGWSL
jgi:hypothetical protein